MAKKSKKFAHRRAKRGLGRVEISGSPSGRRKVCRIQARGGGALVRGEDVRRCATACGSAFFRSAAVKMARSKVSPAGFADGRGGAFFVTSEQPGGAPRNYTIRHYVPGSCDVRTVGRFQGYDSPDEASRIAAKLARGYAP